MDRLRSRWFRRQCDGLLRCEPRNTLVGSTRYHPTPHGAPARRPPRLTNPLKRWKLSYEDFRNRSRWADYETAIEDMMERTSSKWAPWYLIPTNDKPYGRLATFTILIGVLGKGLAIKPRPLDPKVAEMAKKLFDLK